MAVKYVRGVLSEISMEWCIDDIKDRAVALGYDLNTKECGAILKSIYDNHDCNVGVNWGVIDGEIETYKHELYENY